MKVILLKDVPKIGKVGTVKEVKPGYGFNYLLPEGLAALATRSTLQRLEKESAKASKLREISAEESKRKATALDGKSLVLKRPAEKEKLFGSVSREELARELAKEGYAVEPDEIILEKAIKKIGTFSVSADFGNDQRAKFCVQVEAQAK